MDSYYRSLIKSQNTTDVNKELDSRSYAQALLNNYMDAIGARKASIEERRYGLQNVQDQPTTFENFDLRPLTAFVDSTTGSRLTQGYTPPPPPLKRDELMLKLENAISKDEAGLVDDQLNLARLVNEDQRVRDRMDMMSEEKSLDRMLREKLFGMAESGRNDRAERSAQAKGNKPPKISGDQWKAGGFARRVEQTESVFNSLMEQGYQGPTREDQFKSYGPREYQSPLYQQFEQAERNFITALLRRESGAAISAEEFKTARQQYIPQPGDSLDVLSQKKANRAQALVNLRTEGGDAYKQIPLIDPNVGKDKKSGRVRVTNGQETVEIDRSDLNDAIKDGYREVK